MTDDAPARRGLDPADWIEFRRQSHRMLDDMLDHLEGVRGRPVWRPVPEAVKRRLGEGLPQTPTPLGEVYDEFRELVLPYGGGNIHPGFLGWVQGGGTPTGMLAEMLAADGAPHGIRANAICPGNTLPGMSGDDPSRWPPTPGGEQVTAEDVAACVAYLASDEGRHVSGASIRLDAAVGAALIQPS